MGEKQLKHMQLGWRGRSQGVAAEGDAIWEVADEADATGEQLSWSGHMRVVLTRDLQHKSVGASE